MTSAKLPPPPRSAQKRSSSSRASTWRALPSAVTTSNPVTRSSVSPSARPARPMPPLRDEPADGHVGTRARGRRQPATGQRGVQGEVADARADRRARAVQPDAVERADVDDDGAAARRAAVVGVPARARDERDVVAVGPADDRAHVVAVAHPHHGRRADRVEAAVEDDPGAVVAGDARRVDGSAHGRPQGAQPRPRKLRAGLGDGQPGGRERDARRNLQELAARKHRSRHATRLGWCGHRVRGPGRAQPRGRRVAEHRHEHRRRRRPEEWRKRRPGSSRPSRGSTADARAAHLKRDGAGGLRVRPAPTPRPSIVRR